jgi:adenosylcobinamide kinase / adenosylcobinamide-phosphate guanylyltransferase
MGADTRALPATTLVLGGARSGKSRYAETLIECRAGARLYLATAEPGDAEMAARIRLHRARRGDGWRTIEEPLELVQALKANARPGTAVLVDCLTLWLANLMGAGRDVDAASAGLVDCLGTLDGPVVLVSNEVGLGIVPDNADARRFRDHAGRLHEGVASVAGAVVLMVAGQPLHVKGASAPAATRQLETIFTPES